MQIKSDFVDIQVAGKAMRTFVAAPASQGRFPGIVLFSDIFQLSRPAQRAAARLAGHGFVVAAHEIFHRREPAGKVFEQTDEGRAASMQAQLNTPLEHFDEDCRAVIGYLQQHPQVEAEKLGATGFCIGGHLAFRAALQPEIRATVCFYPTWLHNGKVGLGEQADSLQRAGEIRGELLVLFGALDALIPAEGRDKVLAALEQAGVKFESRLYPAEHGFVRDDRTAYDPECADAAFAEAVQWFRRL
jgi:carboxymethylenebutenolidase